MADPGKYPLINNARSLHPIGWRLNPFWYRVVAIFLLISAVAGAWWCLTPKSPHHIPRLFAARRSGGAVTASPDKSQIIHLPDSSVVILSDDSRLDYPAAFADSSRDVYLNGEGYFDIVPNPGKPFFVHTGNIVTVVLGTSFDIMAYPADGIIQVTVAQGRVRVLNGDKELGLLTDNQQISFDTGTEQYELGQVDTSRLIAWKPEEAGRRTWKRRER